MPDRFHYDDYWAYQLAVVVDDAAQGVTDVVRGADLLDSTPRQMFLQRLLGLPTPRHLHVPVLRNEAGEKLSKQTGACAVTPHGEAEAVAALLAAARSLGLPLDAAVLCRSGALAAFWPAAIIAWANLLAARGDTAVSGRRQAQLCEHIPAFRHNVQKRRIAHEH